MPSSNYKAVTEDGGTLFTMMHMVRTRNKLLRGKLRLDIREKMPSVEVQLNIGIDCLEKP